MKEWQREKNVTHHCKKQNTERVQLRKKEQFENSAIVQG